MILKSDSPFQFDPDRLLLRLSRTLPARVEAIQPVVDEILEVVREMRCSTGDELDIEVSLLEALANAVRHGCREDPKKTVEISVACEEEKGILIVVRDPGAGFDVSRIPSPITGRNLLSKGGRGIFLINQLMDEVHHRRNGTEIWMRKVPNGEPDE